MQTCYRHPDRETGVSCSNCDRPICPECMTPTSVGMRCPECTRDRTKVVRPRAVAGGEPSLTYAVIGICVVVYLGELLSGAGAGGDSLRQSELVSEGALDGGAVADGELWRIVTWGFLHADLLHLALNSLSLWILGSMLEPSIGRPRFAVIFAVSLLSGAFGALLLDQGSYTVGASGAVFGLMGAAFVVLRHRGIDPMQSGLGLWLGLNLVLTFRPGISIGGHLGGLVGGALAALVMYELADRMRLRGRMPVALAGAIGVLAAAGSFVVAG